MSSQLIGRKNKYHKLDDTLVEWIIETDNDLISSYEKH